MTTHRSAEPATTPDPATRSRRIWLGSLAAALIGAIVIVAMALANDADRASDRLELSLGAGESTASCLPFSEATLAGMPAAFAGTVTTVDSDAITLTVDRWYAGGGATIVELRTVTDAQALLAGFPFEVGSEYLITAADGAVSYCGYSGPATAELRSAFDAAFAG